MTSRRSSGSIRAESAVEPTRSENITVTWRRSADASVVAANGGDASEPAITGGVVDCFALAGVPPSSPMARRIFRRSPRTMPRSFKS